MLIQPRIPKAQKGIIMLITLTALMIMTLASVALMRSSDVTQVISGNLAFRQTVVQSSEMGIEAAVEWMESVMATQSGANGSQKTGDTGEAQTSEGSSLESSASSYGYSAIVQEPNSSQTWDEFWENVLKFQAVNLPVDASTGNQVSYAIQRLCDRTGKPGTYINDVLVSCQQPPDGYAPLTTGNSAGVSSKVGKFKISTNPVYYRITVRITGPRNSMSYVQSIIVM